MIFKDLLLVVSFIPAMVMAQPKPATPPVFEKPVAVNPSAKLPAAPNSANLATKPPAPQNPPMSGYQATHGGNMGAAPQQQLQNNPAANRIAKWVPEPPQQWQPLNQTPAPQLQGEGSITVPNSVAGAKPQQQVGGSQGTQNFVWSKDQNAHMVDLSGNVMPTPKQPAQMQPAQAPQKRVGSVPPHNIGDF